MYRRKIYELKQILLEKCVCSRTDRRNVYEVEQIWDELEQIYEYEVEQIL